MHCLCDINRSQRLSRGFAVSRASIVVTCVVIVEKNINIMNVRERRDLVLLVVN